ncbi:putative metalloprotease CJM1_0395 family protein [Halarcobacter bivalviorum]|uniref:putative metalloprotease CJM1_0395 family protein n=1 Tax=Halarcobacter bivalviorum TaxID=663364 RepID=UPI00100AC219|nr:putative metalloprotease CJM1_0395 family protein [Halarcobacter bivalviorum]RXK07809.1 hypothetical protein CRU97_00245 [Halarcobacter bivalviorum]
MEINSYSQSSSSIYQQLAQKRAELSNIDKKELEKTASDNYDKTNASNEKFEQKDYQRVLEKYKNLDADVKSHEQTHASRGTTTAPIQYNYHLGPDGRLYANGGSVRLDTSIPEEEGSANAKLEELKSASTAVDALSSADAQIARTANLNKMLLQAQGDSYEDR